MVLFTFSEFSPATLRTRVSFLQHAGKYRIDRSRILQTRPVINFHCVLIHFDSALRTNLLVCLRHGCSSSYRDVFAPMSESLSHPDQLVEKFADSLDVRFVE